MIPTTSACTIRLLGLLEVKTSGRLATFRRKTWALLAYLAATDKAHRRRALMELFCQEADDPAGALRWHLSFLRRQLGSAILLTQDDTVQFNRQLAWVDSLEFQSSLSGQLAFQSIETLLTAVDLYHGEFLAGLSLADTPEFDLWLLAERAHLRRLYERGLSELVARLLARRDYEAALHRAQQLVQSNPLLEEAHARLIWLYAQTDRREAALAQFEHCRELLRSELAVEPTPELVALYAQVLAGQVGPSPAPVPATIVEDLRNTIDFVGRDEEQGQLYRAWQAAAQGRGSVVLLEAEAGAGKTRLVREFGGSLPDALFLTGACYETTQVLPYHPWIELLETRLAGLNEIHLNALPGHWLDYLVRLLPGLADRLGRSLPPVPPTGGNDLERFFTTITQILFHLPLNQPASPLLLFIDNLQWADETSLRLFHFVARRLPRLNALLVGTYRTEEVADAPALQTMLGDLPQAHLLHLRLRPLSLEAITRLTCQLWPHLPPTQQPQLCRRLVQATGGNALFVTEVLGELAQNKNTPESLPVPESVRALIGRRLRKLSPSIRQVIEAMAVVDAAVTLTMAQDISARSEDETVTALEAGLRWGFLTAQAETHPIHYNFSHDLMREAVISQASQVRRQVLHRRAALTLEHDSSLAATLAYHWRMAGDLIKEGHYVALAGEQAAAVYANNEAVRYLERALQLVSDPAKRIELMAQLSNIWELTGQATEAEKMCRQALTAAQQLGDRQAEAHCLVTLGRLLRRKGAYAETLACLKQAQTIFTELDDQHGLSQVAGGLGAVHWSQLDYPAALSSFGEQLRLAQASGDRREASKAVGSMAVVYTEYGDYVQAMACYQQRLQLDTELGDRLSSAKAVGNMGMVYEGQGDLDRAFTCYVYLLQTALDLGDRLSSSIVTGNLIKIALGQGYYALAERLARQAVALCRVLKLPLYLCDFLYDTANVYIRQHLYVEAQPFNTEALTLATQIGQTEIQFPAQLMALRLELWLKQTPTATILSQLETLLEQWPAEREQAIIHYTLWQIDPNRDVNRQRAAELYRQLYAQTPNLEYRQRYTELTGDTLPAPPPLPDLPALVTQTTIYLDSLLRRVDEMLADLTGISS